MARPVVAIVGRPNVGKSTIFNRLIGDRLAIVEDKPGITRDRIYGISDWNGKSFSVIDTGGIEIDGEDTILKSIRVQAELAIEEADVIVFMCEAKSGVTNSDEEVAQILFRSGKPVVLAINKVDNMKRADDIYEFYSLGFGDPIGISGSHGTGLGDLLDAVVERLPEKIDDEYDEDVIRVALIGRPNVGKSSWSTRFWAKNVLSSVILQGQQEMLSILLLNVMGNVMCLSIRQVCVKKARYTRTLRNTVLCVLCVRLNGLMWSSL